MSEVPVAVREFFHSYRAAFEALDAAAIADHFSCPLHIASDDAGAVGLMTVGSRAEWVRVLEGLLELYRVVAFRSAHVRDLQAEWLTDRLVRARVHWAMRGDGGRPLYQFMAEYTLAAGEDGLRIVALAHDEFAAYRRCRARLGVAMR